jgi:hypothetical protein
MNRVPGQPYARVLYRARRHDRNVEAIQRVFQSNPNKIAGLLHERTRGIRSTNRDRRCEHARAMSFRFIDHSRLLVWPTTTKSTPRNKQIKKKVVPKRVRGRRENRSAHRRVPTNREPTIHRPKSELKIRSAVLVIIETPTSHHMSAM